MKQTTIYTFSALALLLALAACMRNDVDIHPKDVPGIPVVFTATGLNPTIESNGAPAAGGTRATVDGDWQGVQTVAVKMGEAVKEYTVTPNAADNTKATLSRKTDPFYRTGRTPITVSAWWPLDQADSTRMPDVVVKKDQSKLADFRASDFVSAEEQTVTFDAPTLAFKHRTARVTIVLTDYTEGLQSVQLRSLSTEGGNPADIVPYAKGSNTYTALVAPQRVAEGTAFIACTFTTGKIFVYKMKKATEWKAGGKYTYTVSLAAAKDPGYTVSEDGKTYTVYNANGLLAWNEAARNDLSINCYLAADIDMTGKEWTPVGSWTLDIKKRSPYTGTFDGRGHTITGLTIRGGHFGTALIGCLLDGTVQNLHLENVDSYAYEGELVAGVVGYCRRSIVSNCHVSGRISGFATVGGVVGRTDLVHFFHSKDDTPSYIVNCSFSGSISGQKLVGRDVPPGFWIGGVVGGNEGCFVIACHASCDIDAPANAVGGVVGKNINGNVFACYHASGNIIGRTNGIKDGSSDGYERGGNAIGGVVGESAGGDLVACYHALGVVSVPYDVKDAGGVLGYCNGPSVIACYWSDYEGRDIGYAYPAGPQATKVDGTNVTWQKAVDDMNAALQNVKSEWRYEFKGALPTLKKQ